MRFSTASERTPLAPEAEDGLPLVGTELGNYYGFRWFHVFFWIVCMLTYASAASLVCITPFSLKDIKEELAVDNNVLALATTTVLLGSIPGMLIGGYMGDYFGRRSSLIAFVLTGFILSLLHLAIPRGPSNKAILCLLLLRTLIGMPYGGLLVMVVPYLIEFFPDTARGGASMLLLGISWQSATFYGIFLLQLSGNPGWREISAVIPVLPSCLALIGLFSTPESPRWLLAMGRNTQFREALRWIMSWPPIIDDNAGASLACVDEKNIAVKTQSSPSPDTAYTAFLLIVRPAFRWTALTCAIVYMIIAGLGNSLFTWWPTIYGMLTGLGVEESANIFKVQQIIEIIGCVVGVLLIDAIGSRALMAIGFLCQTLTFISMSLQPQAVYSINALFLTYTVCATIVWNASLIYIAELFPTRVRGFASGVVCFSGRVLSVLMPSAVGVLIDRDQLHVLFRGSASLMFFNALLTCTLPRDKAGRALLDDISSDN